MSKNTGKGKRFFTSASNPMLIQMQEDVGTSIDKNDSQMSKFRHSGRTQKIIDELNTMYGNTREKILELVESLKQDKRKDHEIKKILLTEVKFMSRASIYNALPPELKREYTKSDPLPKTINVAHKVIDVPEREPIIQTTAPEEIKQLANEIPLEEYKSDLIDPLSEEDPKDLEIAFLKEKVSELEEALKKTRQFQPATALESQPSVSIDAILYQDEILKLLQKQADGVHSFFYDAYGIDLFKNRELAQLKNSGVKVFRRLYFEV